MKRNILFVLALLFSVQVSFAAITVKGRVFDKATGQPMEYATVRACTLPDKTFVSGCVTDPSGHFTMELDKGRYELEFQFMGFITAYKNIDLDGTKTTVDVGKINLSPDQQMRERVHELTKRDYSAKDGGLVRRPWYDLVVTLEGWKVSEGCKLEVEVARACGIEVMSLNRLKMKHWQERKKMGEFLGKFEGAANE